MSQDLPEWYRTFQNAVRDNLPSPEEIGENVALGWAENPLALEQFLQGLYLPPAGMIDEVSINEYGHVAITVTGLDLTGEQELDRDYLITQDAKVWFIRNPIYEDQRLLAGWRYQLVLVPRRMVPQGVMDIDGLKAFGARFGYSLSLAGVVPRLIEALPMRWVQALDIGTVVALHEPDGVMPGYLPGEVLGIDYRGGEGEVEAFECSFDEVLPAGDRSWLAFSQSMTPPEAEPDNPSF